MGYILLLFVLVLLLIVFIYSLSHSKERRDIWLVYAILCLIVTLLTYSDTYELGYGLGMDEEMETLSYAFGLKDEGDPSYIAWKSYLISGAILAYVLQRGKKKVGEG